MAIADKRSDKDYQLQSDVNTWILNVALDIAHGICDRDDGTERAGARTQQLVWYFLFIGCENLASDKGIFGQVQQLNGRFDVFLSSADGFSAIRTKSFKAPFS